MTQSKPSSLAHMRIFCYIGLTPSFPSAPAYSWPPSYHGPMSAFKSVTTSSCSSCASSARIRVTRRTCDVQQLLSSYFSSLFFSDRSCHHELAAAPVSLPLPMLMPVSIPVSMSILHHVSDTILASSNIVVAGLDSFLQAESLFMFANTAVLPFWILLIFFPKTAFTKKIMTEPYAAVPFAMMYAYLVIHSIQYPAPGAEKLLELFSAPLELSKIASALGFGGDGTAAAWIHYIVFDLLAGRWIWMDGLEKKVFTSHSLTLTLMFGPMGFLLHIITRVAYAIVRKSQIEK